MGEVKLTNYYDKHYYVLCLTHIKYQTKHIYADNIVSFCKEEPLDLFQGGFPGINDMKINEFPGGFTG